MKLAKHVEKGSCLTFNRRIGLINLSHNLGQGLHFFLKGIHITSNIKVVVILQHLLLKAN